MSESRILRESSHITCLGLSARDVRIIDRVIPMTKELRNNFDFEEKLDLMAADIIFINAENKIAMDFFAKYSERMQAEPIFVRENISEKGAEEGAEKGFGYDLSGYPNAKTISTPIKLVDLRNALLGTVATPKTKPKSRTAAVKTKNIFRILVVDDSFPVRKYLENKLPVLIAEIDERIGFDIQYASSGRDAVEKVQVAKGAYDMVFLDIMMEDIDGYRICKWIKKVKSSINVVMLTSKSSPIDRVRANMSGCDNYLSKPPKDAHLKKVILKHKKFDTPHFKSKQKELR